jgi:hypothetical protein
VDHVKKSWKSTCINVGCGDDYVGKKKGNGTHIKHCPWGKPSKTKKDFNRQAQQQSEMGSSYKKL